MNRIKTGYSVRIRGREDYSWVLDSIKDGVIVVLWVATVSLFMYIMA